MLAVVRFRSIARFSFQKNQKNCFFLVFLSRVNFLYNNLYFYYFTDGMFLRCCGL